MKRCLARFVVALGIAAPPSAALADRVVVGPIRGDGRLAIERRIVATLSERMDVIPWEEFLAGYRGRGAAAMSGACDRVSVRTVIRGEVNSRRSVRLTAYSCSTGEVDIEQELALFNGVPERTALSDAMHNLVPEEEARRRPPSVSSPSASVEAPPSAFDETIQPRVGDPEPPAGVDQPTAPQSAPPEGELPSETTSPRGGVSESAFIASATLGQGEPGGGPGSSAPSGTVDDESPAASTQSSIDAPARLSQPSFLELQLLAALATRNLSVPIVDADTSVGYSGGGYTEIGASGTFFPLVPFVRKPWAPVFGLTGQLMKGVAMPVSEGAGFETDAIDGSFGLLARLSFGGTVGLEVRPLVSYGFRGFAITPNDDVATFNYRFYRMGAELRALLVSRRLALAVSGAYRVVTSLGEALADYGERFEAMGWDVGVSASLRVTGPFELSVAGEYVAFSAAYDGDGAKHDALTSSDVFPRAFLRVGVALQ